MPTDTTKTDIALLQKDVQYIKEGQERQEKKFDSQFEQMQSQHSELKLIIKGFIDSANERFVTNDELVPIKEKQKTHDEIISRLGWASFWGFITIVGGIVGVLKFM